MRDVHCQLGRDNSIVLALMLQMSPLMSPDVTDVSVDVVGRSIKLVISPGLLWEAANPRLQDIELRKKRMGLRIENFLDACNFLCWNTLGKQECVKNSELFKFLQLCVSAVF